MIRDPHPELYVYDRRNPVPIFAWLTLINEPVANYFIATALSARFSDLVSINDEMYYSEDAPFGQIVIIQRQHLEM